MSIPDRLGSTGRLVVTFLAGMLVALLIVLAVVVVWRQTSPATQPPATAPLPAAASTATPSIDPSAGDYEHGHETAEDEKPQWAPVVLGFAKNFTNTTDRNPAAWRQRLAPLVSAAVRDQLADVDPTKVPAGRYDSYELLEAGNYQVIAKIKYGEGWALVLYVTSDGRAWKVTAYDRWEQ